MEATAVHRYIGSSPRKMRLLIDLIRGLPVEKAIETLHFSTKHASKNAEKVVRSAVANLMNRDDSTRIDAADIYIKQAFVNQGPTLKRISPAPQGRANKIRKRSCHLTIVVATRED